MYEITMPKLSDSMQEGKIIAWKVKEGDQVREGQVLAEVESDKATMEMECFHDGVLSKIVHGDDSVVRVGEVIGYIEAKSEAAEGARGEKKGPAREETESARETKESRAAEPKEEEQEPEKEKPAPRKAVVEEAKIVEPPIPELAKAASAAHAKEREATVTPIPASPYARRLAQEKGISLEDIKGTGPGGRITAQDVESHAPGKPRAAEEKKESKPAPKEPAGEVERKFAEEELPPIDVTEDEATVEEASFRQRTQARRVVAAKHSVPHFYITRAADVTHLYSRKEKLKEELGATITHVVMLAALKAIEKHPEVNRSYDRGKIYNWKQVNLGLAVDTSEGLTVAVIPAAQRLSLKELVEKTNAVISKARAGKLSPEERRHPTFTVSTLGKFEVDQFEPIINPPSSITLAVASALQTPAVKDGMILIARTMKLTLSCDHRIVDGVTAARFLAEFVGIVENDEALIPSE